ncbi:MAG TPA: hypothetical protein VGF47_07175 [Solirubrobacteraceae bacterium]|jgi:hypothetical protein
MSRLDDLPPDQRATLSLLLRRGKSYSDVATMLEIDERAVHDRAHAALAVLAPAQARQLSAAQREQVGDYLLGQQTGVAERLAARTYLDSSSDARAWANALAAELQPLASTSLPEIPAGKDSAPTAPPTPSRSARPANDEQDQATEPAQDSEPVTPGPVRQRPSAPSSRLGGALLLVVIVVVVIVVVLLTSGGGGSHSSSSSAGDETSSTETSASGKGKGKGENANGTQKARAKEDKRITLTPPDTTNKAVGVAEVLSEGTQYAFYLAAQHLEPSKGFFYAVWLYNSPTSYEALSRAPNVGASGSVQGGALLPKDASKYHTLLLTKETASQPTKPGPIVLRGAFALH